LASVRPAPSPNIVNPAILRSFAPAPHASVNLCFSRILPLVYQWPVFAVLSASANLFLPAYARPYCAVSPFRAKRVRLPSVLRSFSPCTRTQTPAPARHTRPSCVFLPIRAYLRSLIFSHCNIIYTAHLSPPAHTPLIRHIHRPYCASVPASHTSIRIYFPVLHTPPALRSFADHGQAIPQERILASVPDESSQVRQESAPAILRSSAIPHKRAFLRVRLPSILRSFFSAHHCKLNPAHHTGHLYCAPVPFPAHNRKFIFRPLISHPYCAVPAFRTKRACVCVFRPYCAVLPLPAYLYNLIFLRHTRRVSVSPPIRIPAQNHHRSLYSPPVLHICRPPHMLV